MDTQIVTLDQAVNTALKKTPVIKTREEFLSALPKYMTTPNCRRWLLHINKTPYYANGFKRHGKLDSQKDLSQLVSFDEAYKAYSVANTSYTGLGFALGPDGNGGYWQGIDLDDLNIHSDFYMLKPIGYGEISPSGNGLHFIGYGQEFITLGTNETGIEAYYKGRFFTISGNAYNGLLGFTELEEAEDLSNFVEQILRPMHGTNKTKPSTITSNDPKKTMILSTEQMADLRSALFAMSSDSRELWIAMGHALSWVEGGRELWGEWSATSSKYQGDSDLALWDGFSGDNTNYKSVFKRAQENGWINPHKQRNFAQLLAEQNTIPLPPQNHALYPEPLPTSLPDVMQFQPKMLPIAIRDYIYDVADRQQSPPDFVAVAAIIGLAGLLGRKALIYPKQYDDWVVTPNQWGVIIGRPSAMKSPSMNEALKPLIKIEANSATRYKDEAKRFTAEQNLMELEKSDTKSTARQLLKENKREEARRLLESSDISIPLPIRNRLIVNDATIEKLGELLNENTNGLILVRDEIAGWIAKISKEEYQADRAFYLECFDGNGRYVYDRIGRGTIEIDYCTLSIIGGLQPAKITNLVREAMSGVVDDGLIQRFQLATWPDDIGNWNWIDRVPNITAKASYYSTFDTMHNLSFAHNNEPYCFRFTPEAQHLFIHWMEELQVKARGDDVHPAIESHMLKMPQTIAGLSLLFELIDGGRESVGLEATKRSLIWADYLLSHANRLYGAVTSQKIDNARLILNRKHKLPLAFSARDIRRKEWVGLKDAETVNDALECLVDYKHLIVTPLITTSYGGRPSAIYEWTTYG